MKPLKSSSLLYKLNDKLGTYEFHRQVYGGDISLCTLFWSTVHSLIASLLIVFFGLCLTFATLFTINALLSPLLLLIGLTPDWLHVDDAYRSLWAILVLALILGFALVAAEGMKIVPYYLKFNKSSTKINVKKYTFKDSYIYNYYKAVKDKMCPIIKVEHDK